MGYHQSLLREKLSPVLSKTIVSQFTLLASTKKGNKPDFHGAAGGDMAKTLYDHFFQKVKQLYAEDKVKNGVFQAMMDVGLVNDGPVSVVGFDCARLMTLIDLGNY